jgi:hypothetical protein
MASDDAKSLIQHYSSLWSAQANFRNLWNTTAQFVMPAWDNFIGDFAEGVNRNTRVFDSGPIVANERFAAAMEAILTPRNSIWHKMTTGDEELDEDPEVARWLDQVNKIMFACRYHPEANFASQTDECYLSLGAFGNDILFTDEVPGRHVRYRALPMSEICWSLNHAGNVDTLYRKFRYSAKQAVQHWGRENVPAAVARAYSSADPYQELEFLHAIRPNDDHIPGAFGDKGKRFECYYIFLGDSSVIERSGYATFPCAIGRYRVAPREHYGRGPAISALPDIRTSNEMIKTELRVGQKALDPPVLLAEDSVISPFNQRPGAANYGMVSADGRALAIPFESKGRFDVGEKLHERVDGAIKDTFLNTLFQILVQNPNMTATEALLRAQEKGELIAPAMGRQQSEFLGNLVTREYNLLLTANQFPPMPVKLAKSGRGCVPHYTSPMARAMRAEEGTAIMNTVADLAQMANLDKTVLFLMDFHDAGREMAAIRGCPAKLLRTEEQVQDLLEQASQQAQQNDAAQQAPQVAAGVQKLASAAQIASSGGAAGGAPGIGQAAA